MSGQGNTVFNFVLGKEELRVLRDILAHFHKQIPPTTETQTLRHRIKTMQKCIEKSKILSKAAPKQ
jgi:hypothetical protein